MNNFLRDLRLGVRTAFRSPGYSVVAVVTMALAIGANTLLFSIASPLVVRPLPLGDPDTIAWLRQTNGPRGVTVGRTSMPDYLDWRETAASFSDLAAREMGDGTLIGAGDARRVALARVTTNIQSVWGLSAVLGRLFQEGEDTPGRAPAGVISHRFWQEFFNSDPTVLGRTFSLDGQTLTIMGVMSPTVEFGNLALIDIWVPLPLDDNRPRDVRTLTVMGTMAPGATLESVGAEMSALASRLAVAYPTTNRDWEVSVLSARAAVTAADTWVILGLMGVVVFFVLLIACTGLANLARARLVGRKQDLTVRQALGASRLQLVRPLVSESLVLGVLGGRRRGTLLIVSQVAMALSLLVVSALAVQSMLHLRQTSVGLDVDRLMTFKFDLPTERYANDDQRRDFTQRLASELRAIPGARSAALVSHLPVLDPEVSRTFTGTERDGTQDGEQAWASWFAVTPSFFETSGVSLVAGRLFEEGDGADRQPVAVLGRLTATRYFSDPASAVGRTVRMSGGNDDARLVTIVGVVEDTKNSNVTEVSPQVYVPLDQAPTSALTALVSSEAPSARITDARAVIRKIDAGLAITMPKTLAQIIDEQTSSGQIVNGVFVGFAGLALLLAAAGLYGVISFAVGQRRQEFGVRLALGAAPGEIRSMVVREGLKVSLIGVAVGLVLAWGMAVASASILYGITPEDPRTYVGVTLTVLTVALLAVWIPATRTMHADPLTSLRAD